MRRIYIYIYIYAISQGGCAGLCASNFSPESSFSRNSFVWRWVSQGFCMFYVHLCRLKSSLSLTWGQPAGLPGTRGYAPHMRQVFFSRPRGGTLFHGQKRKFATSRGLRHDMRRIYIYIYAISVASRVHGGGLVDRSKIPNKCAWPYIYIYARSARLLLTLHFPGPYSVPCAITCTCSRTFPYVG